MTKQKGKKPNRPEAAKRWKMRITQNRLKKAVAEETAGKKKPAKAGKGKRSAATRAKIAESNRATWAKKKKTDRAALKKAGEEAWAKRTPEQQEKQRTVLRAAAQKRVLSTLVKMGLTPDENGMTARYRRLVAESTKKMTRVWPTDTDLTMPKFYPVLDGDKLPDGRKNGIQWAIYAVSEGLPYYVFLLDWSSLRVYRLGVVAVPGKVRYKKGERDGPAIESLDRRFPGILDYILGKIERDWAQSMRHLSDTFEEMHVAGEPSRGGWKRRTYGFWVPYQFKVGKLLVYMAFNGVRMAATQVVTALADADKGVLLGAMRDAMERDYYEGETARKVDALIANGSENPWADGWELSAQGVV